MPRCMYHMSAKDTLHDVGITGITTFGTGIAFDILSRPVQALVRKFRGTVGISGCSEAAEGGSKTKSGYEYLDEQLGGLKDKVTINKYQSAENVNDWWKARGYNAPYKEKTIVQNITLTEDTKFVRVYDGINSSLEGGWVISPEDIRGLTSKEIQAKFALEYEPKYIGEVELKAGDTIRLGEVGPNFGFDGGGIQIDLQQQWIGDFTEIGEIKTWRRPTWIKKMVKKIS